MKIDWDKYVENAKGSEDAHQIALMAWSSDPETRKQHPELEWLFHIPNGGSRHKAEAGKLKAMGVKPGVPDLFLPLPRWKYHGLFIELKKVGGKKGPAQSIWLDYLVSQNYRIMICFGWQNAKERIIEYLSWKKEYK